MGNFERQQGVATLRTILLLFTGTLLVLVLAASFVTSFGSFRNYVSGQLAGHARDGATAVGLSLSNSIDARDPVAASSLIDAVFDSGRYLSVRYLDNQGHEVAGRAITLQTISVPAWFRALADLELPVAEAQVIRGWSRLGKVQVISHPGRAYEDLWRIAVGLVLATLGIGGIGLLLLYLLLRHTLKPLRALEAQARALGQRDFRRRVSVNSTRELNQVTSAMNQMSDDLEQLFEGQARLIQHLRRVNSEDPVTGLASRAAFDQRLKVEVESEEKEAPGVLVLLQLSRFADYNSKYGREEGDRLLRSIAGEIEGFISTRVGAFASRRMGAEFAVFVPGVMYTDAKVWCEGLVTLLDGVYADAAAPMSTAVHGGLARTRAGRDTRELMAAADSALRRAQAEEGACCQLADTEKDGSNTLEGWRELIARAIREQSLSVWLQPMLVEGQSEPVYRQVFSRIDTGGESLKAGVFVPMAERFGMIADIDRLLVQRVLEKLQKQPQQALAISLGSASVASAEFREDLMAMVSAAGDAARGLWVGISEQTIRHHRIEVGLLVRALGRLQIKVLVDRFGVGGVPFSYLRNLRFQALRIDNSFIHDIDSHEDNRFYLESVIAIAHSRGVKVFATGVETAAEYSVLCALGIDGAMGYHLGRPYGADKQSKGD